MDQQSWSVVVFCFNEVKTVASVIDAARQFFQRIGCSECEIVVVDDGSTDGSRAVIRQESERDPRIKMVFHEMNRGIGEALRSGYFNARFENVVAVPADGQFDLKELDPFSILKPGTFVSFYRLENTIYSFTRNILSYFNKLVNAWLLGIRLRDVNWVKIYKREAILMLDLRLHSSLVESEICSKLILRGNKPVEAVSVYHARKAGVSKGASGKIVLQALNDTSRLIWVIFKFRIQSR